MLFKILHGDKSRISTEITPYHEGYCYVTHDGDFYVDMNDERVKLNAKDAETLLGASLNTILNSSDLEIPTSKAVLDAINEVDEKASVQPNWNQNDDSAPDYIQNRTHWEEKNYVEIISKSVTFDGEIAILSEETIKLIAGKTYSVTINGTEYNCVAVDGTTSGGTANDFLLGNTSMVGVGTNTREPFIIISTHNMETILIMSDGTTAATISIVDKQSDIHKLDNKFLDLAWLPVTEKGTVCIDEQRIIVGEIAAQVSWISEDVADKINNGEIQVGDIFVVSFDGVRYECPLAIENVYGQSRAVLGNLSLIDDNAENTGEPFVVWDIESTYVWTETEVEHTIMVCYSGGDDEVCVNKIPAGFLPNTVLNHYHEIHSVLGLQEYLDYIDHRFESLKPKSTTISLSAAKWTGNTQPYSQVVTVNGVTENSKVDLQPTATQIVQLKNEGVAMVTENNMGKVTIYALGAKPSADYTMQVLVTEVIPV